MQNRVQFKNFLKKGVIFMYKHFTHNLFQTKMYIYLHKF